MTYLLRCYLLTYYTVQANCFRSRWWGRAEGHCAMNHRYSIAAAAAAASTACWPAASRIIQSYVLRAWLNMGSGAHNAACVRDVLSLAVRKEFCSSSRPPGRPAFATCLIATPSGTVKATSTETEVESRTPWQFPPPSHRPVSVTSSSYKFIPVPHQTEIY